MEISLKILVFLCFTISIAYGDVSTEIPDLDVIELDSDSIPDVNDPVIQPEDASTKKSTILDFSKHIEKIKNDIKEKMSKVYSEKFTTDSKEVDEKLEKLSASYDNKLNSLVENFNEIFDDFSATYTERIDGISTSLGTKIEEVTASFNEHIAKSLEDSNDKIDQINKKFHEKVEELSKYFNEKLHNNSINLSVAIESVMDETKIKLNEISEVMQQKVDHIWKVLKKIEEHNVIEKATYVQQFTDLSIKIDQKIAEKLAELTANLEKTFDEKWLNISKNFPTEKTTEISKEIIDKQFEAILKENTILKEKIENLESEVSSVKSIKNDLESSTQELDRKINIQENTFSFKLADMTKDICKMTAEIRDLQSEPFKLQNNKKNIAKPQVRHWQTIPYHLNMPQATQPIPNKDSDEYLEVLIRIKEMEDKIGYKAQKLAELRPEVRAYSSFTPSKIEGINKQLEKMNERMYYLQDEKNYENFSFELAIRREEMRVIEGIVYDLEREDDAKKIFQEEKSNDEHENHGKLKVFRKGKKLYLRKF